MRIEYDQEADAAYVYLVDKIKDGEAKKTIVLNEDIILDFNDKDKLLGIEILNAKKILNEKSLVGATIK
jgi:uncharacterized protein YuzE